MRVFNDVKFLFYFTYLRNLWEDYPQNHNIIDFNEASCKNISVFTTDFFLCRKMSVFRCRSPPIPINLKNLD